MTLGAECYSLLEDSASDPVDRSKLYEMLYRKIWDLRVNVSGSTSYDTITETEEDSRTDTTTISASVDGAPIVINTGRENRAVFQAENGSMAETSIPEFNPPGIHGKRRDEDLIKLRYNACFMPVTFHGYFNVIYSYSSIVIEADNCPDGYIPPKPATNWTKWSVGDSVIIRTSENQEFPDRLFLMNGDKKEVHSIFTQLSILGINKEKKLSADIVFGDFLQRAPGPGKLTILGKNYPAKCNLSWVVCHAEWKPGEDRDP